jgi:serine/threonine protein kinase
VSTPVIAGRYLLRRRLGAPGTQGEVYEALDTYEGDVVAVKLLTGLLPPGGPWVEARILRRLADHHILPIRNADLASGVPYLVTELATHGTLDGTLATAGPCGLDVDDVVRWTCHACHGVARAHDLLLLHNDLKPANLFLNAQGECLVGDFGFASLLPVGATVVQPAGATAMTAAPEVAAGWGTPAATASVRSDVYSLGATAYWLLAARPPHDFTGAADAAAQMAIVVAQAPPRLRDVAPHVPNYVSVAIETAIARASSDRHASVTDLASALGRRPAMTRRWRRTDEHVGHLGCWRGEPDHGGSVYVVCLEVGSRPSQITITTRHAGSGHRVLRGCRVVPRREWGRAIRSVMRALA